MKKATTINHKNILVAKFACKENRPHINAVYIEPDGTTVATDGHILAKVTGEQSIIALADDAKQLAEPILIPLEDANALEVGLRSKRSEPGKVAVYKSGGMFEETTTSRSFAVHNRDEKFPPYEEILHDDDIDYACVALDVNYLSQICQQMKKFLASTGKKGVKLYISKYSNLDKVMFKTNNLDTDQEMTVVLMPLRRL